MSEQIDWSKAPEGATHYVPAPNDSHHPIWLKMDGNTVLNAGYIGHSNWAHSYTAASQPCTDLSNAIKRPTTQSWSGEGLPPVGVVCEVAPDNDRWGFSTLEIRKCLVIAYHADFVWLDTFVPGIPVATRVDKVTFRPIRTLEQIAADERYQAVMQMSDIVGDIEKVPSWTDALEAIYDAGYRKP